MAELGIGEASDAPLHVGQLSDLPGTDRASEAESEMSIKAIWLKILSGKPLTEAEELAWHNHWCEDSPSRVA
jgi:hypothetical protein